MLQAFNDMQKGYSHDPFLPVSLQREKEQAWHAETSEAITVFWKYWNALGLGEGAVPENTEEYQQGYDAGLRKGRRDAFGPWYYAEDGEIWELSGKEDSGQYIVNEHRFFKLPIGSRFPASFASDFHAGELKWENEYPHDTCADNA